MPHYSNPIGPTGALLQVYIGVSTPRTTALIQANQQVPLPLPANLQIDTGAAFTAIDAQIVNALGLQPIGATLMATPSSGPQGTIMPIYDIMLAAIDGGGQTYMLGTQLVLSCNFGGQGIDGLLGRDILAAGSLIYSGPDSLFLLAL